jgi:hypothetical protein
MCNQGEECAMVANKNDLKGLGSLLKKTPNHCGHCPWGLNNQAKEHDEKKNAKLSQNLSRMSIPWSSFIWMIIHDL